MSVAPRFVLPLALLAACVGAYLVSERLGDSEPATAAEEPIAATEVPFTSVRRLPELITDRLNAELLASALPEPPPGLTDLSCLTIMVDGKVVHDLRGDSALVPGAAQLLLTAHTAMALLGPDHRYRTAVMAEALPDEQGVVHGGLYLVGGGDPVFMTHNYAIGYRPIPTTRTAPEALAEAVVEAGVAAVDGGVVGVDRRYDGERFLPGWPVEVASSGLVGPLSALQLDDGFAERPAANAGVAIPAEDPALHAATRFDDLLEDLDVVISAVSTRVGEQDAVPELVPIAAVESPPLSEIVAQTLIVNDAGAAEMIMKELGFAHSRQGATRAGGEAIGRVLAEQGVELTIAPRDGSGLDPVSAITCRLLAEVAASIPDGHPTLDVLPAYDLPAVYDGELADVELDIDLRVVGGTVGDATGLVGRTVDGDRTIVIASIVNRALGTRITDRRFQIEAVAALPGLLESVDPASIEVEAPGDP